MRSLLVYITKFLIITVLVGTSCSSPQRNSNVSLVEPEYPGCKNCNHENAEDYIAETLAKYAVTKTDYEREFIKRDLLLTANYYEAQFDFDRAKKYQKALLELDADDIFLLKKYSLSLIRSGDLEEALVQLMRAYEISADKIEKSNLGLLIGSLYESSDQRIEAAKYYQEILKFDASNVEACIRSSRIISSKDFNRSIATLQRCHDERKDKKAELSFHLGRAYLNISDLDRSERYFMQAYEENSENSKSLAALAVIYQETGRDSKLASLIKKHLKKHPDDYLILSRAMDYYVSKNNFKKAVKYLEKMTDLNPRENSIKFKLVYIYRELKEYRKAIRTLEEVLSMGGDRSKAYYFLADVNFALGQNQIALLYLEKVKKDSPFYDDSTIKLLNNLKEMAFKARGEKIEKLESRYLNIVRKRRGKADKSSELFFDLAVNEALFWDKKEKFSEAGKLLESVVEHESFTENHKYFLASILEKLDRYDDSDKIILSILEENPSNPHALNFIGYSYLERSDSDLERAHNYLSKALKFAPNDGHILDSYGWYLFKTGNVKKSLSYLLKALKALPNDPTVNKHVGQVYQRLSNYKKANSFYDKAVRLTSDSSLLKEIEGLRSSQSSRLPASVD